MSRVASLALLLGLAAGCSSGEEAFEPVAADEPDAPPPVAGISLTSVRVPPALDHVQVGGREQVDYFMGTVGCGGAWLDYDNDGDPDLYLVQGATPDAPDAGPPDLLLRNDGNPGAAGVPGFTDVTEQAGLGDRRYGVGAAAADYDGDGDIDLYLTNWGPNRLYRNDGDGTFTDVAPAAGVDYPGWSTSAAWSDVDHDGDLDLYVANYVVFDYDRYPARGEPSAGGGPPCTWKGIQVCCGPRNLEPDGDVLYRNDGDSDDDGVPRFVDVTARAGLAVDPPLYALSVRFFDADDDGDDDLFVANDSVRNSLFLNDGAGGFRERGILAGVAYNEQGIEQAGMGIATADYDGDGLLDLAVTNFSHDHDTLYRNLGNGLFRDVSYNAGLGSPSYLTLGWGVAFEDLDDDGWPDLFVAQGHVYPQVDGTGLGTSYRQENSLYRNTGAGTFEEIGRGTWGPSGTEKSSRAVLPVDLDGDGDLDFLVTQLNDRPELLRNDTAPGNWLTVRLSDSGPNRDGLGARVTIEAGGRVRSREIRREASFAGSKLPTVRFGLGAAERVETLRVRWPDGETTTRQGVEARQVVVVSRDD